MKKMLHIRNSIIIILSITVILMGIGFVIIELKYNNLQKKKYTFNPVFTDITKTISLVKESKNKSTSFATISDEGSRIKMKFRLESSNDEIAYVATIKNKGTLPCKIIDVIESPNYKSESLNKLISPVSITISDIKDKVIEPGKTQKLKIVVYYNPTKEEKTKEFYYDISFFAKSINKTKKTK